MTVILRETYHINLMRTEEPTIRTMISLTRQVAWAKSQGVKLAMWTAPASDDNYKVITVEGDLTPEQETEFILRFA